MGIYEIINRYVMPFMGVLIFFVIIFVGIKIIQKANKVQERASYIYSLGYIAIGAAILSLLIPISKLLYKMLSDLGLGLDTASSGTIINIDGIEDKKSWLSSVIAMLIDLITISLKYIIDIIGRITLGYDRSISLSEIIFSPSSLWFPDKTMTVINTMIGVIAIGTFPLLVIAVLKTGIQYIASPFNIKIKAEAEESLHRWLISILLIAITPLFVTALLDVNDILVTFLENIIQNTSTVFNSTTDEYIENIRTGSDIMTSIVKLVYIFFMVKIFLLFVIRKIMIIVFAVFTPIAAYMWAINKNVNAAAIWFGEILSNIFMQFFYAFVFIIPCIFTQSGNITWLETIIWLYMLTTLGEALRNSMQGLYTRLSGVSETGVLSRATGSLLGLSGIVNSFKAAQTSFMKPHGYNKETADYQGNNSNIIGSDTMTVKGKSYSPFSSSYSFFPSSGSSEENGNITNVPGDVKTIEEPIDADADSAYSNLTLGRNVEDNLDSIDINANANNSADEKDTEGRLSLKDIKLPQITYAQSRYIRRLERVNMTANRVGKAVGTTLAVITAPLGKDASEAMMKVGMVIGGSVRAVGTVLERNRIVNDIAQKYSVNKDDAKRIITNSPDIIGANAKLNEITKSNILGNYNQVSNTLEQMRPDTNKSYIRWNFAPATFNQDMFRWDDKIFSNNRQMIS